MLRQNRFGWEKNICKPLYLNVYERTFKAIKISKKKKTEWKIDRKKEYKKIEEEK